MVVGEQRRQLDDVSYLFVFEGLYQIIISVEDFDTLYQVIQMPQRMAKHRFRYCFQRATRPEELVAIFHAANYTIPHYIRPNIPLEHILIKSHLC